MNTHKVMRDGFTFNAPYQTKLFIHSNNKVSKVYETIENKKLYIDWVFGDELPEPLGSADVFPLNDSFIIIGTKKKKGYIYNVSTSKFCIIELKNEFPNYSHFNIADITQKNDDKHIKKYILFSRIFANCKVIGSYVFECVYNIQMNQMQCVELNTSADFNDRLHLRIQNTSHILILTMCKDEYRDNINHIIIYDFNQHIYVKYNIHQQYNHSNTCHIVYKTKNNKIIPNKLILLGEDHIFEILIIVNTDNPDIHSYSFKFNQLSFIATQNICSITKISEFNGYGCVVYNDFIICFGGEIVDDDCKEVAQDLIHLYDMNKDVWHQCDPERYKLPSLVRRSHAILQQQNGITILHILGGYQIIENNVDMADDCKNHWKLDLGYTTESKIKIWKIFKRNKMLSLECWTVIFDFIDYGFMNELVNSFKPYK
eukprot:146820_1